MTIDYNVDNFIIMSFPKFSGGKFISNCLSLSKHCIPQDLECATYLLANPDDYNYRLRAVLSTLPNTQNEMINWISSYEFGDRRLYGSVSECWIRGDVGPDITPPILEKLIKSNFKMFHTSHSGDITVRNLLKVWPRSTIVTLINHDKFNQISKQLKSLKRAPIEEYAGNYCESKYNVLAGPSWPSWHEFESVGYDIRKLPQYESVAEEIMSFYNWKDIDNQNILFDVDNAIFSRTKFLTAIEKLYNQLGFTDFAPTLVEKFWASYMSLHVDNIDIT